MPRSPSHALGILYYIIVNSECGRQTGGKLMEISQRSAYCELLRGHYRNVHKLLFANALLIENIMFLVNECMLFHKKRQTPDCIDFCTTLF